MINFQLIFSLLATITKTTASDIKPSEADIQFHSWCESVGIDISPSIQLATTPLSVAGRGVFAVDDLVEGETVVKIPGHCVFAPVLAAQQFPSVANDLRLRRRHSQGRWFSRMFRRVMRKKNDIDIDSTVWQAELTAYALEAIESNHPWAFWIEQWQRDDPILKLFESGVLFTDEEAVSVASKELHKMLPELSELFIQAAIQIRLQRFQEHEKIFLRQKNHDDNKKASIARMYAILGSHALDIGDDITAVVPMYDMINHSLNPNLGFFFNGESFEIFALHNITRGEELFFCYNKIEEIENEGWTEFNALWTLVQWGIPISSKDANEQLGMINKERQVEL